MPISAAIACWASISLENYEREHAFGESEVRLLSTVAASMGVALENARLFDETQRLLKETEQRAAELAVINSIQEGMAAELDFQAIVDLVGDKLREVFHTGDIGIRWYDPKTNLVHYLTLRARRAARRIATGRPLAGRLVGDDAVERASRSSANNAPSRSRPASTIGARHRPVQSSMVRVPIIGSDRVLGMISLENYERENAFGEAEVRLLRTVAASMGVALENARLFDETQRLLKETEQRAAELAVINRIQEGMAAELDFQAIVDLVGDKLREVFNTGDIGIRWYDPEDQPAPLPVQVRARRAPEAATVARPRPAAVEAMVANAPADRSQYRAEAEAAGITRRPRHRPVRVSAAGAHSGQRPRPGHDHPRELQRENAYGEAEVRLLSTVAASMGVALENARLFDETQRLLKETEQRAAELAVINSVQEGMAAELDFQAIIDAGGRQDARDLQPADMGIRSTTRRPN